MANAKRKLTKPCKKTGNRIWDFRIDNVRTNGSAGTPDEKIGERLAWQAWEKARDEAAERKKAVGRRDMKWRAACESYYKARGAYASHERDLANMAWVSAQIGEDTYVSHITHAVLEQLIIKRRGERCLNTHKPRIVSQGTVNLMTKFVRKILKRCRIDLKCYLPDEPRYGKLLPKVEPRQREMMIDEEIRLRNTAKPDLLNLSLFILYTGLRKEAALLTWDQVHLHEGVMHVTSKGKFQQVPIVPEVRELLLTARKHRQEGVDQVWTWVAEKTRVEPRTGQAFIAGRRYPFRPMGFYHTWKRTCARAGITNLNIHDLRKTLGARMVRETGNLRHVQIQLNHSNITVTAEHYAHIAPNDVKLNVMETLGKSRARLEKAMREEEEQEQEPVET